jgi:dihydropteroate synthase
MGVLNVTPDSFSDGACTPTRRLRSRRCPMADDGADIVDVGVDRPVRVRPHRRRRGVQRPAGHRRAARLATDLANRHAPQRVAKEAAASGASIVNDISGALDPRWWAW